MLLAARTGAVILGDTCIRQGCQSARQIAAAMQEIDDDHLFGIVDEDHEMLSGPGETQILGKCRIDKAATVLRKGRASSYLRAVGYQIVGIGGGLPRSEGLQRPARDLG